MSTLQQEGARMEPTQSTASDPRPGIHSGSAHERQGAGAAKVPAPPAASAPDVPWPDDYDGPQQSDPHDPQWLGRLAA